MSRTGQPSAALSLEGGISVRRATIGGLVEVDRHFDKALSLYTRERLGMVTGERS
jgi:hypothetical protein